jgi:ADP-heptose:LPS heptosyltransferase
MIIIAPYAKALRNGKLNPKTYPFWKELIEMIDEPIIQVGVVGEEQLVPDFRTNLPIVELRKLIQDCRTWISCDSFFQHLGWDEGKPGIVLWSVSDPLIFGHKENINLLKDRKNLVANQFLWWENVEHQNEKFVPPHEVIEHLRK